MKKNIIVCGILTLVVGFSSCGTKNYEEQVDKTLAQSEKLASIASKLSETMYEVWPVPMMEMKTHEDTIAMFRSRSPLGRRLAEVILNKYNEQVDTLDSLRKLVENAPMFYDKSSLQSLDSINMELKDVTYMLNNKEKYQREEFLNKVQEGSARVLDMISDYRENHQK